MIHAKTTQGKVGQRSEGLGSISPALVTRRAEEIALGDGRRPEDYTDEDWNQALEELRFEAPHNSGEENSLAAVTPTGDVPSSSGHQAPKYGSEDEETIAEDLVQEGIDEAVRDELTESGKDTLADEDLDRL